DAARRQRHALLPLDPSNWRRLFVRNGRVLSALPELEDSHPLQRPDREASLLVAMQSLPFLQKRVTTQLSIDEGERTILVPKQLAGQKSAGGDETLLRSQLGIGLVTPELARTYP